MNMERRAPQLIAQCIDSYLTTGVKGKTQEDVTRHLEAVVKLSNHLHDRDVFLGFMEQFLSKRLLNKLVADEEAEEGLIKRIQ